MSLTLNMVGGGGGSLKATDAILRVIAPAGSTVTISKGGVSKSDLGHENADDHSLYDYYFIIHASQFDSNPWTVTATLSGESASDTIVIDSADEYDIQLEYYLYFVKNGQIVGNNMVAEGKKWNSSSSYTATAPDVSYEQDYIEIGFSGGSAGKAGITYFPAQADLSKYSTLRVIGESRSSLTTLENSGVNAWTQIGTYQVDNRLFNQATQNSASTSYVTMDISIDVSSFTDSVYIGFNSTQRGDGTYSLIRLVNVYLVP